MALSLHVVVLIKDLNGNHVIQKCLNKLAPEDNQVRILLTIDTDGFAHMSDAVVHLQCRCCELRRGRYSSPWLLRLATLRRSCIRPATRAAGERDHVQRADARAGPLWQLRKCQFIAGILFRC